MKAPKILIVDDDQDILDTLCFELERKNYEVLTAANGWEALGAVRIEEPDLIVLDVMLPKENGYRVARFINEDIAEGKILKKIPIILLTARQLERGSEREKIFSEFSHTDNIIYKPFEMDNLLQKIEECLLREE